MPPENTEKQKQNHCTRMTDRQARNPGLEERSGETAERTWPSGASRDVWSFKVTEQLLVTGEEAGGRRKD